MRSTIALLTLAAAVPLSAQQNDPLAFLRRGPDAATPLYQSSRQPAYRPVRSGEVRSSGFLTEMSPLPFGMVLGPVMPPVMHATESNETALPGSMIGVRPPAGVTYQAGDTILLARIVPAPDGWGSMVIPTGLARVGDHTDRQTQATIITTYGPIRMGQVTLPLEPVNNPGSVQPVTIAGPTGQIVVGREVRELEQVGGVMFINVGRAAGVRIGDFFEVHRRAGPRLNAADTIDDLIAVAQVVHVGDKSSTIKFTRVLDPDIPAGAPVNRIATLPN